MGRRKSRDAVLPQTPLIDHAHGVSPDPFAPEHAASHGLRGSGDPCDQHAHAHCSDTRIYGLAPLLARSSLHLVPTLLVEALWCAGLSCSFCEPHSFLSILPFAQSMVSPLIGIGFDRSRRPSGIEVQGHGWISRVCWRNASAFPFSEEHHGILEEGGCTFFWLSNWTYCESVTAWPLCTAFSEAPVHFHHWSHYASYQSGENMLCKKIT